VLVFIETVKVAKLDWVEGGTFFHKWHRFYYSFALVYILCTQSNM